MKPNRTPRTLFVFFLLCCALPAFTVHAQEQGFRWGKWFQGYRESGSGLMMDEVVDSYIDSAGNSYVFGVCGLSARLNSAIHNGPYICPADSILSGQNIYGIFLAKIDTLGNILWCKSARGATTNSPSIPWNNIVVKDGKITIAFDFWWISAAGAEWFYFFDTILTASSDILPKKQGPTTCFVTFDMDGNMLDYHSVKLYAYCDWDYISFHATPFGYLKSSHGNFLIDEDDNIHIFTSCDFFGEDSLHKAYIIVDGDTNKRYPLNIKTLNGKTFTTSMYFKMDSDWNLIKSRFLIDSISVWNPDGRHRAYIEFYEMTIVDDGIYASCFFHSDDYQFIPDTLPIKVFLDSVHYLRIDNTCDWRIMPCLLKLNMDGEVVWVQQLYNEYTRTPPNGYIEKGDHATDENNVYAFYWLCSGYDTRFYIDSSHNISVPHGPVSYILIASYDRNTGSFVDYYIIDTINKNLAYSLDTVGENLIIDVCFQLLEKTELCKINKYTKEITRSSPITYAADAYCTNMSVNDHGWVFRGEMGRNAKVYDSIFIGNYMLTPLMAFFYDSALDLHRPKPCSPVDSLWCNETIGHSVTLSWSSPFAHPDYELAYIPVGGSWDDATIILVSDTTASVTLTDDQCHLFRVRGLCDGNRTAHSPWSNDITVCPQVGISEADGASAISLYPNPTNGMVHILGLRDHMATVEVLDMSGRLLKTVAKTSSFDISDLPSGSYIVRVKTHHDNETHNTSPLTSQELVTYLKLVKK